MKNNKAIEILQKRTNLGYGIVIEGDTKEIKEALDVAIKALEFQQGHAYTDKHCRDCKWLCGDKCSIGIRCMNPNRKKNYGNRDISNYKMPSYTACKTGFEPKGGKEE